MAGASWYLAVETVLAIAVVLGTHALRRRTSLVYSYAVLSFMTLVSWAVPHGPAVPIGPLQLHVESAVFFSAALVCVFVLYVADGPRAGKMGIVVMVGTGVLYTGVSLLLSHQFAAVFGGSSAAFPTPSLRAAGASIAATAADLVLMGIAWEAMSHRCAWAPVSVRVLAALLVVFGVDTLVYVPLAWAGEPGFASTLAGTAASRLVLALVHAPILGAYLHREVRAHGLRLAPRPMLSIVSKEDLERELLSARHGLRIGAEALWESEERYRQMVDDIPTMVFRFSQDGQVTYANQALCSYYGRSVEEILGTQVLAPIDGTEREYLWGLVSALTPSHPSVEFEAHAFPRPAERRLQRWLVRGIFSPRGEGLAYQAVGEDITERRASEQMIRRLSAAIEHSPECVGTTDTAGRLEFANGALLAVLGRGLDEVRGAHIATLVPGLDGDFVKGSVVPALLRDQSWSGRLTTASKDGKREFQVAIGVIRKANEIDGYVALGRDITRELKLEALAQQAQRMESLGFLAGGVAHDFNNLLMVIWSCAELACDHLDESAPGALRVLKALQDIRRSADSAAVLTKQLMAMSRKEEVAPQSVSLSRVATGVTPLLRRLVPAEIALRVEVDERVPCVMADPSQIERVIVNLVTNARDAVSRSDGVIRVRTRLEGDETSGDRWVVLSVADNGSGMDPETVDRIFEPFFTTKGASEGTGLGLATVYGIAQQAGGRISVQSAPGTGTEFLVRFPAHASEAAAAGSGRAPEPSGVVWYCEDDERVRNEVVHWLEAAGLQVKAASAANGMLLLLEEESTPPDVVLVDAIPPGMTGQALVAAMRYRHPGVSAVYLTGRDPNASEPTPGDRDHFVKKPYRQQDIVDAVKHAVATSRRTQQEGSAEVAGRPATK